MIFNTVACFCVTGTMIFLGIFASTFETSYMISGLWKIYDRLSRGPGAFGPTQTFTDYNKAWLEHR